MDGKTGREERFPAFPFHRPDTHWRRDMALKIAVIGAGNIGGALLGGILKSKSAAAKDVLAIDASEECRTRVARQWKVKTAVATTPAALSGRGLIVVAVKPQIVPAVLQQLRGNLKRGQVIV